MNKTYIIGGAVILGVLVIAWLFLGKSNSDIANEALDAEDATADEKLNARFKLLKTELGATPSQVFDAYVDQMFGSQSWLSGIQERAKSSGNTVDAQALSEAIELAIRNGHVAKK